MENRDSYKIPAANIGDTDLNALARTNPEAAQEIARLEDLMNNGKETKEEFRRLCKLLFDAGSVKAAEILLRRNLDYYDGHALYAALFGTEKQKEFDAAIEAFKSQFSIQLMLRESEFLISWFRSEGGFSRSDAFSLLAKPCDIKIGYIEEDRIEADINLFDPTRDFCFEDECLFMYFVNGIWEIAEPIDR